MHEGVGMDFSGSDRHSGGEAESRSRLCSCMRTAQKQILIFAEGWLAAVVSIAFGCSQWSRLWGLFGSEQPCLGFVDCVVHVWSHGRGTHFKVVGKGSLLLLSQGVWILSHVCQCH